MSFRSRVIVKNLPYNADEEKLKSHFGARHPVTDVKLMRGRDGKSRRFCFLGFKSDESAADVVKYFNDSYLGTAKISVEVARSFSDDGLVSSKEKKRRAQDAEREREAKRKRIADEEKLAKKARKAAAARGLDLGDESNPKLKEFLEVYGNRQNNTQSWKNDDIMIDVNTVSQAEEDKKKEDERNKKMLQMAEGESDDEYQDMNKLGNHKESKGEGNDDKEEEGDGMMSLSDWTQLATQNTDNNESDGEGEKKDDNEDISDAEWLRKHQSRIPDEGSKEAEEIRKKDREALKKEQEAAELQAKLEKEKVPQKTEEEKNIEKIERSKRLFLRNLLYSSTEDDFRNLFSKYGQLEEVHLAIDTRTGKSKGFAYIQFVEAEDAINAYQELDKQIFQGRLLHILPAEPKKENKLDEYDLKNLPLKKQNEIKRKLAAAKQQFSWNTLYLNNDAVMDTVAKRLGVKKAELLSPDSSDAAVTQALAEASVINSVRQYFESKGIDLLAFNKKERSDKIILVKNFPFDTSAEEIAKMFSEYGDLRKVLMPPDGGIAMVVFKNAPQARAAFSKLAYRRFKSSILYLEKGPKGLFEEEGDENDTSESVIDTGSIKQQNVKEARVTASDILGTDRSSKAGEDDDSPVPSTSIFVKNLNFDTTSTALTEAFKSLDGFLVAQVKTKINPKKPGSYLSMGFGFVEFNSKEAAEVALKVMDGHVLDGHKLQLKISHRGQDSERKPGELASGKKSKKGASTKILIKNLPFEASKEGVYKIFSAPGGLRTVRVPRKFDKSLRGFAFAEYTTVKDAENAINTLQGTHYYGRHLVLEYAKADASSAEEEIAAMEAKVRKQVTNIEFAGHRLSGKQRIELEGEDQEGEDSGF